MIMNDDTGKTIWHVLLLYLCDVNTDENTNNYVFLITFMISIARSLYYSTETLT